jgi:hypothetical protein
VVFKRRNPLTIKQEVMMSIPKPNHSSRTYNPKAMRLTRYCPHPFNEIYLNQRHPGYTALVKGIAGLQSGLNGHPVSKRLLNAKAHALSHGDVRGLLGAIEKASHPKRLRGIPKPRHEQHIATTALEIYYKRHNPQ